MLAFERVSKRYGGRTAVDDVTLVVRRGSLCGLLGRNGAGKTTLLRMLVGLARPSIGATAIDGVPYRALTRAGRKVGVALEHPGFHPRRTGRAHLRALARAGGLPRSRVDEVLRFTELSSVGEEPAGSYSLEIASASGWRRPCWAILRPSYSTSPQTAWTPPGRGG